LVYPLVVVSASPISSGPVEAAGVVSVAVPEATPLTYNVIVPVLTSYTPTRCVQLPNVAVAVDVAATEDEELAEVSGRPKLQLAVGTPNPRLPVNPRVKAELLTAPGLDESGAYGWPFWETAVCVVLRSFAGSTHADTVNDPVVSSTGPAVLTTPPFSAPPDHVTPLAVAGCPVPEASGTVVPEVWFSGHHAVGVFPPPCSVCDCEVMLPIGS
jgi:hypothetical protein